MKKYLVFFKKNGYLIYISSLDTVNVITRALRRAHIPFTQTEGYSPHPKLSFSPSLSLGFSSNTEFFEIELKEDINPKVLKTKLNEVLPKELNIMKVKEKIPLVFQRLVLHKFSILLEKKYDSNLMKNMYNILENSELKIIKKNKKGKNVTYDLKEYLYSYKILENKRCILMDLYLYIKNGKSLNPRDIILLIKNHCPDFSILRIKRSGFFIEEGERFIKI